MRPIGKSLTAGLVFMAIGAFFAVSAWIRLPFGTATGIGPGYFPFLLAVILIAVGVIAAAIQLVSASGPQPFGRLSWRSLLLIAGSPMLFAITIDDWGLAPALVLATMTASFASTQMRLFRALLLSAGLTVFCLAVFVYGLDLPMPIIGNWLGK